MRNRLLVAAAGLAALAVPAAPASASSDATHRGGCGWTILAEPTATLTPDDGFAAVLDAAFVVASPSAGAVGATVTCTYYFGGEDVSGPEDFQVEQLVLAGDGVLADARQATVRGDLSALHTEVCETVDYADDTPTYSVCSVHTTEGRPAGPIFDSVDALVADLPWARDAVCATLRSTGPAGTNGLFVNSDGDVHVTKYQYWDC